MKCSEGGNGFDVMAGPCWSPHGSCRAHQSYGVGQDSRDIRGQQRHRRGNAVSGGTEDPFNGVCTPFEQRMEVINVKGGSPVSLTVRRTIHGPVVATGNWRRLQPEESRLEAGD